METTAPNVTLEPLSESDLTVRDPAEDVRDDTVYDRSGEEVGTVKDLIIDRDESRVRFLKLGAGGVLGIGAETLLVPVDAITLIDDQGVHIDQSREHVAGGPKYQPELTRHATYYGEVYGYYGYVPFWGAGYAYPSYPHYPPRR